MKKKFIIIVIFAVAASTAVSFVINMRSERSEAPGVVIDNEPAPVTNNEEPTFNLMGREMTLEEAIEHCQQMPEMPECESFPKPPPADLVGGAPEETDGEVPDPADSDRAPIDEEVTDTPEVVTDEVAE